MDNHRQAERPVMVEAYLMAGRLQARRGGLGDVQQVIGLSGLVIPPRRDRTRQQQTAPHRDLLWPGRAKTRLDAVGLPHGQPPRLTRAAGLVHQHPGHPPIGESVKGGVHGLGHRHRHVKGSPAHGRTADEGLGRRAGQKRRPRIRAMSKRAVLATAITVITPACTGSVTTRSACSGTEPAMFREMTRMPRARTSSTASVTSPPISAPASTTATARGSLATARTALARFSSPTIGIVSTLIFSPRMLCRSASPMAPTATWPTCTPAPTTMIRLP